jgi:hypothetical protein
MEQQPVELPDFLATFTAMPTGQLVLFGLFAATWLIGGNILVAFHYKRVGKHWASGLKPFAFPFKDFNAAEWSILGFLAIISLTFGIMALAYGH